MFREVPAELPPLWLPLHRWPKELKDKLVPVMTNIGLNPTTDAPPPVQGSSDSGASVSATYKIESHALRSSKEHAEGTQFMVLYFLHRHRDEMVFAGLEELRAQLEQDKKTALDYFDQHASGLAQEGFS
jgi:FAD synthase